MSEATRAECTQETAPVVSDSNELVFWLNGCKVVVANPDPTTLLVEYLHEIGLTGTKVGCGQGGCGACTVMLSQRDPMTNAPVHRAVNSCLRPLCAVDGMMVTTTEGIGSVHDHLDPTQYCIAAHNGTQCGFCTPGFVMNAHAFLQQQTASQQEIEDIFGGNLCRCTGYRPILHGLRTLARDYDAAQDATRKCVIDPSFPVKSRSELARIDLTVLPSSGRPRSLRFTGSGQEWYRPSTLAEVHRLKKHFVGRLGREHVKLVFDQARIARALGIQANQVTVIVEQIGGGFGGKQHRAGVVGAQAAVAARKLNRPVRLLFDRATDSLMIGKRHPYHGEYHVAYTREGILQGLHLDLKSDAGDTYDCSFAVMDLSLLQSVAATTWSRCRRTAPSTAPTSPATPRFARSVPCSLCGL